MFLVLALFTIPYYMAFLWIDDKRRQYVKNDLMYPDMSHASVASPAKSDGLFKQASEDKKGLPPLFEINEEKEDEVASPSIVAEDGNNPSPKQVRFESPSPQEEVFKKEQRKRFESKILKEYDDVQDNKRFSMVSAI